MAYVKGNPFDREWHVAKADSYRPEDRTWETACGQRVPFGAATNANVQDVCKACGWGRRCGCGAYFDPTERDETQCYGCRRGHGTT